VNEAIDTLLLMMMQRHRSSQTTTSGATEHGTAGAAAGHGLFSTPLASIPVLSIAIPPSITVIHPPHSIVSSSSTAATTPVASTIPPDRAPFAVLLLHFYDYFDYPLTSV
jgi:hypothetical protein